MVGELCVGHETKLPVTGLARHGYDIRLNTGVSYLCHHVAPVC